MIQISLSAALIVYSAIVLTGALGIWVYTEITTRRAYLVLEKQYLWRCVYCSYTYLDADAMKHSECPQCRSINSLEDKRARFVPPSPRLARSDQHEVREEGRHNSSKSKKKGARSRGPRKRSR